MSNIGILRHVGDLIGYLVCIRGEGRTQTFFYPLQEPQRSHMKQLEDTWSMKSKAWRS